MFLWAVWMLAKWIDYELIIQKILNEQTNYFWQSPDQIFLIFKNYACLEPSIRNWVTVRFIQNIFMVSKTDIFWKSTEISSRELGNFPALVMTKSLFLVFRTWSQKSWWIRWSKVNPDHPSQTEINPNDLNQTNLKPRVVKEQISNIF